MPKVPYLDINRAHADIIPQLKKSLEKVLRSGRVVLGEELGLFEKEYAIFSGTKYSVGVANGLDALILSLLALGIKEGDEVIVPSNTYIATLLAISRVGAKPVLAEPKLDTYNIDPLEIRDKISSKTKAIIPVHLFGQSCEMNQIIEIANKNKIFVVEDNAQSHGATYMNRKTGSFGDINATSFYPGKNLGALGDGGAITTNEKKLFDMVLLLRNYGSKKKYYNEIKGYNSRLDELQASFLRIKLGRLNQNNKKRQAIANTYINTLSGTGDLILPKTAPGATHVYHIFTIRTKKRNALKKHLEKDGIENLIHYPVPSHMQKAYEELGLKKGELPIAEKLAETSLSIPIFPEIKREEQDYVTRSIKRFFNE